MALSRLQVTDFRCLQSVNLEFDPRLTLISGLNGSGKTSLLEAIHVLGRGRSFRTRRLDQLIRFGADRFVVFGEVRVRDRKMNLGIEGSGAGVRGRMDGDRVTSLAELAHALPVQIIDPEVHRLIEEGPSRRRRFIDWGVFHVEPNFVSTWQTYQRALRQRNAALSARQGLATIRAWDPEFIQSGERLGAARRRYVAWLGEQALPIGRSLLGKDIELSYRGGWPRESTLAESLADSLVRDQEAGATQVGPHRAEMVVKLDGIPARDHVSRGQQKLLAAALLIAQIKFFPLDAAARPSLLLDDPAAELDDERLRGLLGEISGHALQLIVTTLHAEFSAFGAPGRQYVLQGGSISIDG